MRLSWIFMPPPLPNKVPAPYMASMRHRSTVTKWVPVTNGLPVTPMLALNRESWTTGPEARVVPADATPMLPPLPASDPRGSTTELPVTRSPSSTLKPNPDVNGSPDVTLTFRNVVEFGPVLAAAVVELTPAGIVRARISTVKASAATVEVRERRLEPPASEFPVRIVDGPRPVTVKGLFAVSL